MRVCHLTSVHSANDTRIFIKECQSLKKAGHEVFYVVPNMKDTVVSGVKIIGVQSDAKGQIERMRKTTKLVLSKAIEINADVYHFHDPELIPIGLKLKKQGKKVIYDVHEDVPEQILSKQWVPKPLRKSLSTLVRRYERFASRRFDGISAATPYIAERFKTHNENTITIHNYPLLDELASNYNDRVAKTKNTAVYIGGIYVLRGINEMVKAMEKVNEEMPATFVLAGSFAPPSLEQEVQSLPGFKFTDFRGFLNRDGIKELLTEADMGLVLLHPEPRFVVSLPIKMFEYMSAGVPVIASNFPLWKDIVQENQCGICVDPLNVQEIADAMKWILNHPEEAKLMGENGRKAVETVFNWETESQKLEELYNRL
ncbi:Glycosyltransferase involved in cell wall bisynthesis [Mesobacillus persicus]|uniref:Glycosyltransferase involved in cell wall bisynthesis n=1 Tax=Mesobacillus persicus TaxID=930146 RepID=A0A1H8A6U8_9BACI|nr:glycosyltransferase family 4 protein [Mesobacillus persicus]SEM65538.1 Glycosyltransferase involved in cell wall bisynthesis [Mesobacillus persicus]